MPNRVIRASLGPTLLAMLGLSPASCAANEKSCPALVRAQVVIPYESDAKAFAADYYRKSPPTFIVYITAGDYFPLSSASQEEILALIESMNKKDIDYIPIGWHDPPLAKCPIEAEKVTRFATEWNDLTFRMLKQRSPTPGVKKPIQK